jgi:hypothetical protein
VLDVILFHVFTIDKELLNNKIVLELALPYCQAQEPLRGVEGQVQDLAVLVLALNLEGLLLFKCIRVVDPHCKVLSQQVPIFLV